MLNRSCLVVTGIAISLLNAVILSIMPGVTMAQVEEIVVTARKKEESLQEVPLSIAAFSAEQMRERGINNNYDVASFTPNFNTTKLVGRDNDRPTIRGMVAPSSRGEPNASFFIDGIFVARSVATATIQSMERVEVLRGPQSAQFGRATFAGAVNYVTKRPTNEFIGEANGRAGTSQDYQFGAWVSGPIIEDKLLFLVSGAWDHYGGQWRNNLKEGSAFSEPAIPNPFLITDPVTGDLVDQNPEGDTSRLGKETTKDFLAKLTWLPFETTEVNLKFGYTDADDGHWPNNAFPTLNCLLPGEDGGPESGGAYCGEFKIDGTENRKNIPDLRKGVTFEPLSPSPDYTEEMKTAAGAVPGQRRKTTRLLGEWIQDIYGFTSTVKAAYNDDEFESVYDMDHQQVRAIWGLFNFNNQFNTDDYAFEYSIQTPVDRPLSGKLGVYYYSEDQEDRQRSIGGPLPTFGSPPGALWQEPRLLETDYKAVFGGISFDLADRWTLDLEARYGEDELEITSGQQNRNNEPSPVNQSLVYKAFTPRMILSWQANDDLLAYALVAKGNKPGGFNTEYFRSDILSEFTEYLANCDPNNPNDPVPPPLTNPAANCETDQANLFFKEEEQWTYEAGIKSAWFDRRVLLNLSAFFIEWTNQGIFSRLFLPNRAGSTNTSTIIVNAGRSEIMGLELESNWAVNDNLFLFANYGLSNGEFKEGKDPDFAILTGGDGDITGKTLPGSPKHSLVFGFDASSQVSPDMEGFLHTDFLYETKTYSQSHNTGYLGERKIVNLRLGLRANRWTATLYVRNLTDDDTPVSAFNFTNFAVEPFDNDVFPNLFALNPQLRRDAGLEFQWRFGD